MNAYIVAAAVLLAGGVAIAPDTANAQCRDGQNRRVVVVNSTQTTMRELYGSNIGRNSWEEDVLGNRVLPPGRNITVNFDDGTCMCNFDFKAVFADGEEVIRRNYNVCTGTTWTITGN